MFLPTARSAQWKQLPITVTAWSYGFGALAMGLASVYYYSQPAEFVMPGSVSARMHLQHSPGNPPPSFLQPRPGMHWSTLCSSRQHYATCP